MAFTLWYLSLACCEMNLLVFGICLFLVARRHVLQYSSLDSCVTFAERFNSEKHGSELRLPKLCAQSRPS